MLDHPITVLSSHPLGTSWLGPVDHMQAGDWLSVIVKMRSRSWPVITSLLIISPPLPRPDLPPQVA